MANYLQDTTILLLFKKIRLSAFLTLFSKAKMLL